MTTRRDVLKGGIGLAAILAAGESPAIIKKSLIAARAALTGGKKAPTAKSYVQDGLIAMWDGIENAGWGVHDESATTWVDLVGGNDYHEFVSGVTFGADCLNVPARQNVAQIEPYDDSSIMTIECVVALADWNGIVLATFGSSGPPMRRWIGFRYNGTFSFGNDSDCAAGGLRRNQPVAISGTIKSQNYWRLYRNGVEAESLGMGMTWASESPLPATLNKKGSTYAAARIHAIRLYSRALTAEEIAANYAVDKQRFNLP